MPRYFFEMPPVVAFSGWPGAGKNEAALALEDIGYRLDSFAAPLKELAHHLDPWIAIENTKVAPNTRIERHHKLNALLGPDLDWEVAKKEYEVRCFLQTLGAGVRKFIDKKAWIRRVEESRIRSDTHPTAITDCRYQNEAIYCQGQHVVRIMDSFEKESGVLIWVDREGCEAPNNHDSATGICRDLADHIITNNGTIAQLHAKVLSVLGWGRD